MNVDPPPTQRPPRAVVIFIAIHALSAASDFIYQALSGRYPDSIGAGITWLVALGIVYAYLRAIYAGYNWVRWLLACIAVLGIVTVQTALSGMPVQLDRIVFIAQRAVDDVAVLLLFLPSSRRWYRFGPVASRKRSARAAKSEG